MSWLETAPFAHQPWAEAVKRVFSEENSLKLTSRVDSAHLAIASRIAELSPLSDLSLFREEIHAINQALDFLQELIAVHAHSNKPMVL